MKESGLLKRRIEVVDFCSTWHAKFISAQQQITPILKDNLISIEHIGSTSVEGLSAKPIIDILLEVKSLAELDNKTSALLAIGFVAKGENGINGRRYFQKGGNARTHHMHAFEQGHPVLQEHRAFRDYLIAHPEVKHEYQQVKIASAEKCAHDPELYMALKHDFIQHHMRLALQYDMCKKTVI